MIRNHVISSEEISCNYYHSPIGILKIVSYENYISEISFIDENQQTKLDDKGKNNLAHECIEQLIEFFQGKRKKFTIPVHQNGTLLQNMIWSQLLEVPFGKTISYSDLTRLLGDSRAIKATQDTINNNNIMIIIPNHRVIGSNKISSNYRGGLWRKRWLLQHEFRISNGIQTLF